MITYITFLFLFHISFDVELHTYILLSNKQRFQQETDKTFFQFFSVKLRCHYKHTEDDV
jgi:hypothetical protein